jgi:hypothetical protein
MLNRARFLCAVAGAFALALSAAVPSRAADQALNKRLAPSGGLSCFSIPVTPPDRPSCDRLCAEKGAACTAVNTGGAAVTAPALNCDAPSVPSVSLCRCCSVRQ